MKGRRFSNRCIQSIAILLVCVLLHGASKCSAGVGDVSASVADRRAVHSAEDYDVELFDLDPESKAKIRQLLEQESDQDDLSHYEDEPRGRRGGRKQRPSVLDHESATTWGHQQTVEITVPPELVQDEGEPKLPRQNVMPRGFQFGRGRAYATTKALSPGEVLFQIPLDEVMSARSARDGRIRLMLDANPDLPIAIVLALHLLEERFLGEQSRFADLIDTLPQSSAQLNSTVFYSAREMQWLHGSQLHRLTRSRIQAIDNFFQALKTPLTSKAVDPPLFAIDQFTMENFQWAMGVVWSHAFQLDEREDQVVIAPILSTISACLDQHGCEKLNRIAIDEELEQITVYATKTYGAGEQVYLDLGEKSTSLLMLNHGLARPMGSPTRDSMDVSIMLEEQDPLRSVKEFLLQSINMSMSDSYIFRYDAEVMDLAMVKSLKTKLLVGEELQRFAEFTQTHSPDDAIISLRNEFVFTRAIVSTTSSLLDQYRDDLQREDIEQASGRRREALRAVLIEKEILLQMKKMALQRWEELLFTRHKNLVDENLGDNEDEDEEHSAK